MLGFNRSFVAVPVFALAVAASTPTFATVLYSQGFETDTTDWTSVNRVASGTDGITAKSGSYYGQAVGNGDSFSHWGGPDASTGGAPGAFVPYTTSLDIYLNVDGGFNNGTRFDFDSSIHKSDGTFLRDFIFNAAFFNSSDSTAPGGGTNRFIISAGNNSQPSNAYAANSDHDPIAITTSGWYTFQQDFTDNAGTLAVIMSILDSGGNLVNQWTLSDPTDSTATVAGGSDYGWIDDNEFSFLAIDNAQLTTNGSATPLPAALPLFASGLGAMGLLGWRKKRKGVAA